MSNVPPPPPSGPGPQGGQQYPPSGAPGQQYPGYQPAPGGTGPGAPAGPGGYYGGGGPQPSRGGMPAWAWILAAVVLIGGGVGAFFLFSGDDDDDNGAADGTEQTTGGNEDGTTPDVTFPDTGGSTPGEVLDQARDQLVAMGLSEEEADCVVDRAFELGLETGGEASQSQMLDLFTECDVDLTNLGGS